MKLALTLLRMAGLVFALTMLSQGAAAQDSIKCESNDGHRNYCGNYNWNQVQFDREISDSACVQGKGWGIDTRGLWVDRGCRAYFRVMQNSNGGWNGDQDSIKCESNDGHRNYC